LIVFCRVFDAAWGDSCSSVTATGTGTSLSQRLPELEHVIVSSDQWAKGGIRTPPLLP
jgi:hypothetical protein